MFKSSDMRWAMGRTVCGRRVFNVCPDVRPLSDRRRRRREMSRSDDLDRTPARLDTRHAWRSEHFINDHRNQHVRPNDQPAR